MASLCSDNDGLQLPQEFCKALKPTNVARVVPGRSLTYSPCYDPDDLDEDFEHDENERKPVKGKQGKAGKKNGGKKKEAEPAKPAASTSGSENGKSQAVAAEPKAASSYDDRKKLSKVRPLFFQ